MKFALLKTFLNAKKQLQLMQQDMNSQGRQSLFSSEGGGGRWVASLERGLRASSPKKHFKSRGLEMVFLTFSMV